MCRPRIGGQPSKYWPSEKLHDLGDRLAPDTYDTPNTVGEYGHYSFYKLLTFGNELFLYWIIKWEQEKYTQKYRHPYAWILKKN